MKLTVFLLFLSILALPACGSVQNGLTAVNTPSVSITAPSITEGTATPQAIETVTSPPAACVTPEPDFLKMIQSRSIIAADNGKTLVLHITSRFSFYLDDKVVPLQELKIAVQPLNLLGYVSNGSILGPQCYPIMYEAVQEGKDLVQVKGFELNILVDNTLPESTFPLH